MRTTYHYQLKYAPHIGMFKHHAGEDVIDQLHFMADVGFRAFEDVMLKNRSIDLQEKIGQTLDQRNLEMGVFVGHTVHRDSPNLASGNQSDRDEFLKEITASIEVAKRVNAKWMTVIPDGQDFGRKMNFQTAHVLESLKQASALLEPHGLTMVVEPQNNVNHPGMFLAELSHAYLLCKAVDSPACEILFDIYHHQITEGNIILNINEAWEEIGYFQIGDHPGRKEPGTGEINYKTIFRNIRDRGFEGVLGMEHANAGDGKEGELALLKAYQMVDPA